jgi:hypothetical protein
MITKKTILSIFFFAFLLAILNTIPISAYTFQIPLCNPPIMNTSCINYTSVSPITNAPVNGIMYSKDGYLYLTNETPVNYTIYNNYTNITYNVTNVTIYSYNISNGSSLTIIQNITANDSIIRDWINSKFNTTIYNKSEANDTFAFRIELNELRNNLVNYAAKTDLNVLDSKYNYLLAINATGINGTISLNDLNNKDGLSMTWKIIIIINCLLIVILIFVVIKNMMSG